MGERVRGEKLSVYISSRVHRLFSSKSANLYYNIYMCVSLYTHTYLYIIRDISSCFFCLRKKNSIVPERAMNKLGM